MILLLAVGLIAAFVVAWIYLRGNNNSDSGEGIDDRHHDNDSDSDGGD